MKLMGKNKNEASHSRKIHPRVGVDFSKIAM